MIWKRTCQECGHKQVDTKPDRNKELSNAYCERRCGKCGLEGSLDYGSEFPHTTKEFEAQKKYFESLKNKEK